MPYQTYGAGTGHVLEISDVPVEPGQPGAGDGKVPMFRIRVSIESAGDKADELMPRLRAGMGVSARVVLDRQPLWKVLLAPLLKVARS